MKETITLKIGKREITWLMGLYIMTASERVTQS
jgi:hypothetical protein